MKKINKTRIGRIGIVLCATVAGALVGCVAPRGGETYVETPVYVERGPVVEPEYVYYPNYQVYYSRHTHQYSYQQGHTWVSRPEPRVSANVLFASPSVSLNFHDAPASHHAAVVRQYPKHWAPPAGQHHNEEVHNQERR